jgi:hypothetical protein
MTNYGFGTHCGATSPAPVASARPPGNGSDRYEGPAARFRERHTAHATRPFLETELEVFTTPHEARMTEPKTDTKTEREEQLEQQLAEASSLIEQQKAKLDGARQALAQNQPKLAL